MDINIDQKKLPGVKEVCRDFAVLEDHCLAHNLQEQEIESHLASNVHRSRLVQQDLRVAKLLQEEEDQWAKAQNQKQHQDIERIDNEMAQEIQEQLDWQAEKQKQQEAKDEAIARKLQEREMKEERRRQKQLEAKLEEQCYEERGAYQPPSDPRVEYSGSDLPMSGRERSRELSRGRSPDHWPQKLDQNRRLDSHGNHNRYPEYYPVESDPSRGSEHHKPASEPNQGKNEGKARRQAPEHHLSEVRTKYPEEYLAGRNRNTEAEPCYNQDLAMTTKERAYRDGPSDRDRTRRKDQDQDRERERRRKGEKVEYTNKSQDKQNRDPSRDRFRHKEMDMGQNGYRHRSKDRDVDMEIDKRVRKERVKDREGHRSKDRSRGQELDGLYSSKRCSEESEENADANKQRLYSNDDVFEEPSSRSHSKGQTSMYRGRQAQEEYGMREAMHGLSKIDLRAQELKDMEVARRLQEEELMASKLDKRAAQVAQDEEIARRFMEEEEREYKKSREKERQQRRGEGDYRPTEEEMAQPRTREEYDYQKSRNPKSSRPPPNLHNYVNVDSSYACSDNYSPRPPSRPEAAYKGAYYRQ